MIENAVFRTDTTNKNEQIYLSHDYRTILKGWRNIRKSMWNIYFEVTSNSYNYKGPVSEWHVLHTHSFQTKECFDVSFIWGAHTISTFCRERSIQEVNQVFRYSLNVYKEEEMCSNTNLSLCPDTNLIISINQCCLSILLHPQFFRHLSIFSPLCCVKSCQAITKQLVLQPANC